MYATFKFLHSTWAYLVVFMVVVATINALVGALTKREYLPRDFRLSLFTLIVTHIQLLLGIIYFVIVNNFGDIEMGEIMKNSALRLRNVEHPLLMFIATMLITIGYSKHKKKRTSTAKLRTIAIPYALALIAILAMIPWNIWFA